MRDRALILAALLGLASPRAEAARCEPLGEVELRSQLLDLRAALELDQQATHDALVTEIAARVPCLEFAMPGRLWATFLIHLALKEFAAGGDWQAPLAAAVHLHPMIDRGVGPTHPMFAWTPPDSSPQSGPPAPPGFLLYVDGEAALEFPPPEGVHLVQLYDGRFWASALLIDRPVPPAWIGGVIEKPPHLAVWASLSAGIGAMGVVQRRDPQGADWFVDGGMVAPGGRLAADLRTAWRSPLGVTVEGAVALGPTRNMPSAEARACATLSSRSAFGSAGAAVILATVLSGRDSDPVVDRTWLPMPVVSAGVRTRSLDARASVGLASAARLVDLDVGHLRPGTRWRLRAGAQLAIRGGRFVQVGPNPQEAPVIRVTTTSWYVGTTVGAAFGSET